ncbi:MAG: branched-chain amino acid ABC transporter permease [Alphaproteobacteria bacterium]|nr:branched-chain amino acid ABC transporter permease [Alphaproteobacteria bacterium]
MQFAFILAPLLDALLTGACALLIALGVSLIFSLGGIVSMAHGALYALGAYLAVVLSYHLGAAPALVVAPALLGLLGVVIEHVLFARLDRADAILPLLATFALAMVLDQAIRALSGVSWSDAAPSLVQAQMLLPGIGRPQALLVTLAIAVVAITLTWLLIHRTPFGRVVRAGMQNAEMVGALGIALAPYRLAVTALAVALAGLAGALFASVDTVYPAMGEDMLAAAFVVVVIGGLRSFWSLLTAALLVAVARGLTAAFEPAASDAAMVLLLVLAVLLRPRGLFATHQGGRR